VIEALQSLGRVKSEQGDEVRAAELFEDALARSRIAGNLWGAASSLDELARLALRDDDRTRAAALAREALDLHRRLDHAAGIETSTATLSAAARAESPVP
jgi:Tetratricopeptide repeat